MLRMMSIRSNRICDGTRKKFKSVVALEEVQLMLAPGLNVPPIVDVDREHFAIEIAELPMYLG